MKVPMVICSVCRKPVKASIRIHKSCALRLSHRGGNSGELVGSIRLPKERWRGSGHGQPRAHCGVEIVKEAASK
jgi:hypothetical protein